MDKDDAIAVLEGAKKLIAEGGWCQDCAAKTEEGQRVPVTSDRAARFCAVGAIVRTRWNLGFIEGRGGNAYRELNRIVEMITGITFTATYNDEPERTKEDILALFDMTLERVRRE